jgi:alkylation response protein AidB-like acyl-CoA dehydrogenase
METGLDFDYDEEQVAFCAAIDRFCTRQQVRELAWLSDAAFPMALWRELADLGAFSVLLPGETQSGGALAICAISETLGLHLFPGPLAATYMALQVLQGGAAEQVVEGRALVCVGCIDGDLLPWGPDAGIFLLINGNSVARAHAPDSIAPVRTLGGELWGRAHLEACEPFKDTARALVIGNIATAAYLGSAAWRLLEEASAHAATRKQFGKSLGEFQAVSHPLADCAIALSAAQALARAAACSFDQTTDSGDPTQASHRLAAGALLSARRAALDTAYACHQVFGGIGITLDGPAFIVSRRIRQLASTPPAGNRERDILLAATGLGA